MAGVTGGSTKLDRGYSVYPLVQEYALRVRETYFSDFIRNFGGKTETTRGRVGGGFGAKGG